MDLDRNNLEHALGQLAALFGSNSRAHGFWREGEDIRALDDGLGETLLRSEAQQIMADTGRDQLRRYRGDRLMLIVGEISELHEDLRKGYDAAAFWYEDEDGNQVDVQIAAEMRALNPDARLKPCGPLSEAADVLIRLLDFVAEEEMICEFVAMVFDKHEYNVGRPYLHNKMS